MGNTTKTVRICAVCGKRFKTKIHNKITCSAKCYKVREAALKKARSEAKKRAAKPTKKRVKCVEKISLPKKPSAKKPCDRPSSTKIFIDIRSTDPYKLFFAGSMLKRYAIARIGNEAEKWEGKK